MNQNIVCQNNDQSYIARPRQLWQNNLVSLRKQNQISITKYTMRNTNKYHHQVIKTAYTDKKREFQYHRKKLAKNVMDLETYQFMKQSTLPEV